MTNHITAVKLQIMEIFSSSCNWCWIKLPVAFFTGSIAYLLGIKNYASIIAIMVLIIIDLITAIMSAFKNGNPIESRKILKTATKSVVYFLFLASVHLAEGVVPGSTFLDEMVLSFLALTEVISVMENIGKMGYAIPMKLLNRLNELK